MFPLRSAAHWVWNVGPSLLGLRSRVDGAPAVEGGTVTAVLSVSLAARMANVAQVELVRKCADGTFPQAYRSVEGGWRIPYTDLVDAGYDLSETPFGVLTTVDDLDPLHALSRATEMLASTVQVWLDAHALHTYPDGEGKERVTRATRLLADVVGTWNVCASNFVAAS